MTLVSTCSDAFAKMFFIRYTALWEDRSVNPVDQLLALDKFGTVIGLSSLPPCHLSNHSALPSLMAEGIRFLNSARARALRYGTDNPVWHLHGLHCIETR